MTTRTHQLEVSGIPIEVVRKDIKNLHLAVYPPNGRVRVAVPRRIDDETVRLAVISRLAWIRKRQAAFSQQHRQSQREIVSGESHYVAGKRYRLDVSEHERPPLIQLQKAKLKLHVRPGSDVSQRRALLDRWYRQRLREQIRELIAKWEPIVGVSVANWGIRKMKTRWGSCNIQSRRIWLNLELAKKPVSCLEYILVHEMTHLLERHHNERFRAYMDQFMPSWRQHRDELNRFPLAHEDWDY